MNRPLFYLLTTLSWVAVSQTQAEPTLKQELSAYPNQLICEGYADNNWDLFIMNADGSKLKNLTQTKDVNELYPQVSPNGKMVAFVSDKGAGRKTVRSVWIMDLKTKKRIKVADYARQPFWSPDSKVLGYLPQEFKKFTPKDFSTKGIMFFDLKTKTSKPHPNPKLQHLYNPGFSPDGKWIVSTVHAGMGFKHADIFIEADGDKVIDCKVHGCRPSFSPDGKYLGWGASDHLIEVAPIHWTNGEPSLGEPIFKIIDKKNKIYHTEWSPNGKWITLSRGPIGKGDPTKPGTQMSAREIVGVYATGWNIFTTKISKNTTVNFKKENEGKTWVQITKDGQSYKEPDWIPTKK